MTCPAGKILNPDTGRCVLRTGKIGQEVLRRKKSPKSASRKSASRKSACPSGKILNPDTGRCVLRTGKIGQKVLAPTGLGHKRVPVGVKGLVRSFKLKWEVDVDKLTKAKMKEIQKFVAEETKFMLESNSNVSVKLTLLSDYVFQVDIKYKSQAAYDDIDEFSLLKSLAQDIDSDGNHPFKIGTKSHLTYAKIVE
jgi:hypothetical protein